MKIKRFSLILLALCLFFSVFAPAAFAEGFPYTWKEEGGGPHCKSLFLVNLDTGSVAYSMNPDEPLPMASITKIMTYIVAYETIPDIENTVITVPEDIEDALDGTGSSLADVFPGEQLTGLQLLYLMMVPSGNDAALTLCRYVDDVYGQGSGWQVQAAGEAGEGSNAPGEENGPEADEEESGEEEAGENGGPSSPESSQPSATNYPNSYFVRRMNEKAQELGCENTHFTNPHGLHNENHYSTARDLYKIAAYAMTLPNFTEITGTLAYELAPTNKCSEIRSFYSTNKMFSNYEDEGKYFYTYTTGIKTGSLNESGYCIAASATADGYTYVVIALGSPYIDEEGEPTNFHGEMLDAAELFRWALVDLSKKTVAAQGDLMAEVKLDYAWKKDTLQLVAGENASALLPKAVNLSSITVECQVPESVQAPVKKGEGIGTATLSYAGEKIATVPLVASESVAKSQMLEGLVQGKEVLTSPWFLAVFGVIAALVAVYVILLVVYKKKQQRMRRVRRRRDL